MPPTTWRHTNGGTVKLDAARAGPTACRPCKVAAGVWVRIRDTDFEEAGPRNKSQRMIPLPHFSIERRPPVSRKGGAAPEQGWTAEK
eukprot:10788611-Heterocapsa_arctica.AAC.1